MSFDFSGQGKRHYFKGNIFSTHLVNSLHIIFPEGEKFFIRSCRKFIDRIGDRQLREDVLAFMGQEGMHSKVHRDFWDILEQQGYSIGPFVEFFNRTAFDGVEKAIYRLLGEEKGGRLCLSITAGLEHYTALLAEVVFENEDEFEHCMEEMRQLIKWHAAEELEHKSVAFDQLRHIDNDYMLRATGFTLATTMLFTYAVLGQLYFIMEDEEKEWTSLPGQFVDFMRSLGSPMVRKFLDKSFDYLRTDFHPSDHDNLHYAETFFAANAERF